MAVPFSNTKLRVPRGFQNLLEGLVREVLRDQPKDIYAYGANYFAKLLKIREDGGPDPAEVGAEFEDRFYNNTAFADSRAPAAKSSSLESTTDPTASGPTQTGSSNQDAAKAEEEEVDIDLTDPEVAIAAVKIQAGFKGLKARKQMREMKSAKSESSDTEKVKAESQEQAASDDAAADVIDDIEDEEIDIDLNDPEVAKAAEKIQAGFKGFKARKDMESRASKTPSSRLGGDMIIDEDETGEEEQTAPAEEISEEAAKGIVDQEESPKDDSAPADAAVNQTAPEEAPAETTEQAPSGEATETEPPAEKPTAEGTSDEAPAPAEQASAPAEQAPAAAEEAPAPAEQAPAAAEEASAAAEEAPAAVEEAATEPASAEEPAKAAEEQAPVETPAAAAEEPVAAAEEKPAESTEAAES